MIANVRRRVASSITCSDIRSTLPARSGGRAEPVGRPDREVRGQARVEQAQRRRSGRRRRATRTAGRLRRPEPCSCAVQEDRRGVRGLAGLVARDRVEVGADHRGVRVDVAEPRQPLVVGPGHPGGRRGAGSRRCSAWRPSSPRGARRGSRRRAHAGVGPVAEHAERLAVPRRHVAEREHARRRGAVARSPVEERAGAGAAESGRPRSRLAAPVAAAGGPRRRPSRGVAERVGGEHDELADLGMASPSASTVVRSHGRRPAMARRVRRVATRRRRRVADRRRRPRRHARHGDRRCEESGEAHARVSQRPPHDPVSSHGLAPDAPQWRSWTDRSELPPAGRAPET